MLWTFGEVRERLEGSEITVFGKTFALCSMLILMFSGLRAKAGGSAKKSKIKCPVNPLRKSGAGQNKLTDCLSMLSVCVLTPNT